MAAAGSQVSVRMAGSRPAFLARRAMDPASRRGTSSDRMSWRKSAWGLLFLRARGRRSGRGAGGFVGQDELEEVGVGHVVLAGQGEAFGQGGGELAELERAQGGGEVGAERVGQRRHGVVLPVTGGWP